MPLGFERLNAKTQQPNKLINFIKPLPGGTSAHALDFLSRIAAQCYPVMKENHIAVMALEEYEWNTEFIGRNFNAGEVIQLVLRGRSGTWLPFKHVQMVMMHELAHCKEMNHSRAFWKVRNGYAEGMRELWDKGYTGEGLWGRGRNLEGGFVEGASLIDGDLPEHTCGGTFRRGGRGRKRKRGGETDGKPTLSYAERQQKRILKKFGAGGVKLGDDEGERVKLEEGKKAKPKGKPRVAGSARGRDLRAAAALARFEKVKEEVVKKEEDSESETDSEYDWPPTDDETAAVDAKGKKILDSQGHGMIRICESEDENDDDVKREMEELRLADIPQASSIAKRLPKKKPIQEIYDGSIIKSEDEREMTTTKPIPPATAKQTLTKTSMNSTPKTTVQTPLKNSPQLKPGHKPKSKPPEEISKQTPPTQHPPSTSTCAVCSLINPPGTLTCAACSNVLNHTLMPNCWKCESDICKGGAFINSGDHGRCAVCGMARK